jgi:hypothetical protein
MIKTITSLALLGLLALAAPAAAKPVAYKGKTKSGHTVTFKRSGSTVSALKAGIPVACVSSRTSDTKAGVETYLPPGKTKIGRERKVSLEQSVGLGMQSSATKNYTLTLTRKGRNVTGKLHVNFMVVEPYYNAWGYLDGNTFICQGDTSFTARPRKR